LHCYIRRWQHGQLWNRSSQEILSEEAISNASGASGASGAGGGKVKEKEGQADAANKDKDDDSDNTHNTDWYDYDDGHASNSHRFYPLSGLASGPSLHSALQLGEIAAAGLLYPVWERVRD
jgi:hypothetical protein